MFYGLYVYHQLYLGSVLFNVINISRTIFGDVTISVSLGVSVKPKSVVKLRKNDNQSN